MFSTFTTCFEKLRVVKQGDLFSWGPILDLKFAWNATGMTYLVSIADRKLNEERFYLQSVQACLQLVSFYGAKNEETKVKTLRN